eukprot:298115_1
MASWCTWKCKQCNLLNPALRHQCQACFTPCPNSHQDQMLPYIEKKNNTYWKDITTVMKEEFKPFTDGQDAQEFIAVILEHVGTAYDDEFLNHYFGYASFYKSCDILYSKRSCKVVMESNNSVHIHETYDSEDKWGRGSGMMNFDIVGEYFIHQVVSNNTATEYMLKMMVKANGYDNNDEEYNDVLIGLQCKVVCDKLDGSKQFMFSERKVFSPQFQQDCRCCDSRATAVLRQIPLGADIPVVKTGNHSAVYNPCSDSDHDDAGYDNYDGNMYGRFDDWEDYIDDVYGNCYHDD